MFVGAIASDTTSQSNRHAKRCPNWTRSSVPLSNEPRGTPRVARTSSPALRCAETVANCHDSVAFCLMLGLASHLLNFQLMATSRLRARSEWVVSLLVSRSREALPYVLVRRSSAARRIRAHHPCRTENGSARGTRPAESLSIHRGSKPSFLLERSNTRRAKLSPRSERPVRSLEARQVADASPPRTDRAAHWELGEAPGLGCRRTTPTEGSRKARS